MKTANIRELIHTTSQVLEWVAQGESVEITRYKKIVAVISPPAAEVSKEIVRPDYEARLQRIYGNRVLPSTGQDLMDYDRGNL